MIVYATIFIAFMFIILWPYAHLSPLHLTPPTPTPMGNLPIRAPSWQYRKRHSVPTLEYPATFTTTTQLLIR